jgi:hypothetical protein
MQGELPDHPQCKDDYTKWTMSPCPNHAWGLSAPSTCTEIIESKQIEGEDAEDYRTCPLFCDLRYSYMSAAVAADDAEHCVWIRSVCFEVGDLRAAGWRAREAPPRTGR